MSPNDANGRASVAGEASPDDGTRASGPRRAGGSPSTSASSSGPTASDAFQTLGNDVRTTILDTLRERVDDVDRGDRAMTFSALFDATDVETTAGFAYHLDQLDGQYLRETDDGYVLTDAGERIARAIASGLYTDSVSRPPIPLEDPCPLCGTESLEAVPTDNVVAIDCEACRETVSRLSFPPAGFDAHEGDLPGAFDSHHRHRLRTLREGVCPDCGGAVEAILEPPADGGADVSGTHEAGDHDAGGNDALEWDDGRVQATFECDQCGRVLRCPVAVSLLGHPAVASFYRDHGRDPRSRPIWNVGPEWAERVLSTDPPCVRVVAELDGAVLALYVDRTLQVRAVQRAPGDESRQGPDGAGAGTDESRAGDTPADGDRGSESANAVPTGPTPSGSNGVETAAETGTN